MEKGQMRVEANISLGHVAKGEMKFGTKVEVKNINSFKAVQGAIDYEVERQKKILASGEKVKQETRGWDDVKKITFSQRSKEEAHDYRYFPEPDLPPFETSALDLEEIKRSIPELPGQKQGRFKKEYRLSDSQAAALVEDPAMANFYEAASSELAERESEEKEEESGMRRAQVLLFNYLTSDLKGLMNEEGVKFGGLKISPENLAELVDLIADGEITSRQAKDILRKMFEDGSDPEEVMRSGGFERISDEEELEKTVREIIKGNPQAVLDYKKGKTASLQFLIGKAMGKLKGAGNPEVLRTLFVKNLR
jgi:aspartyl-tRNA(Asn)/glutamyl-tRNA(Gln) amidotransferase subunit B